MSRHRPSRSAAFTLLELLAVVVLLALAAATAAGTLGGMAASAQAHGVVAALREMDTFARLRASTGDALCLDWAPGAVALNARGEARPLRSIKLGANIHAIAADSAGRPLAAIRLGTSTRT